MDLHREPPNEGIEPSVPEDRVPRRDQRRAALRSGLGVILVAAGALGLWLAVADRPEPAAEPIPGPVQLSAVEPVPEPTLDRDGSDAQLRQAGQTLSSDPAWARWLSAGDLARRLAAAASAVAEGESPREPLSMLAPEGSFSVVGDGEVARIAPASFARYEPVARVLASIDPNAAATAWGIVAPTVRRAWQEIGRPGSRVEDALTAAIERMVSVPVPTSPLKVRARGAIWVFDDPALEALPPAEKHLLRMGPENQRRVQTSLRALARALQLPVM